MSSRREQHAQWPSRPPPDPKRFLPIAGSFSATPNPPTAPFVPQQHLFQQYHNPSIVPAWPGPEPLSDAFLPGPGQIIHDGFIPAPGHENDDEVIVPTDTGLNFQTSSEEDSEDERILQEIGERNDNEEIDQDYTASEGDEEDPDDMLIEGEFDDDEAPVPKRGKPKDTPTRGGRRGPARGRGGLRSTDAPNNRKTGVRGRKKGRRGPRAVADPGPEFKLLQQQANEAYTSHDYDMAIDYASKAIHMNPEIFSAWNILSEAYAAKGDEPSSIEALTAGAYTKRDKDLWWLILERIENIDSVKFPKYTEAKKVEWCLICLRGTISLDPNDYNARSRKLALESERGKISKCVKLCQTMLKMKGHEHEYDLLKQMAILGTSSPKQTKLHLKKITQYFETSVAYFVSKSDPTLDWNLINIYLDLLDRAGDYDRALARLKTLCRWKQGRAHEAYWDKEEDDREFDVEDTPRRVAVPEFSRTSNKRDYGGGLPMEIRVKMGIFRLRQTPPKLDEAMHHLNMLEPEDESPYCLLQDYPDVFREVADTLHTTGHDQEALLFYEPLLRNRQDEFTLKSFIGLYTCYKNLNDPENGDNIVGILKQWNAANLDDLAILAKFFEDVGLPAEARQRAETVYKNKSAWRLRKVRYEGYAELLEYFRAERKKARGKGSDRKIRAKKHATKLRVATGNEQYSGDEGDDEYERIVPNERLSLGPLGERPAKGDGFYRRRYRPLAPRPQIFLPVGEGPSPVTVGPQTLTELSEDQPQVCRTLEGTEVSLERIEHKIFRDRLTKLASINADELKSRRAQHREIVSSFLRLDDLSSLADDGDDAAVSEYLSISRELVEEFSTFVLFYTDRRHPFQGYYRRVGKGELWKESALMALAVEANRVEDGGEERPLQENPEVVDTEFWGIHFDKWADAFGRYALYLARKNEKERCFSALDVAMESNIMSRSKKYTLELVLCRLACALAVNESEQVSSAIRQLLRRYPFSTDLIRLYSAANRLCPISDGYGSGPAHKAFLRYIKTIDYMLLDPKDREWFNFRGDDKSQWMQHVLSSGMLHFVKDHDPALFALFGHILASGGTYMGALNYYFRAYAITPDDPIINLSIGIAYLQHAQKRQSENRQFQIGQGIAFMTRYYDIRTKDNVAIHCSEAEFNMGRMWHGLGLAVQALGPYERCLALSERVKKEAEDKCRDDDFGVEDFATEAAFAMQSIYMLSGDFEGAMRVTKQALVIE